MDKDDDIYKYLGLGVVLILAIYIGSRTLNFQTKVVEGLQNQNSNNNDFNMLEDSAKILYENIKIQNDKLKDIVSIQKYRTDYENLIMTIEEYTNLMMLSKVVSVSDKIKKNGTGKNITPDILNEMERVNKLKSFIDSLNSTMKYIDRR
jgi:formyltetrahydrofolate synthetase